MLDSGKINYRLLWQRWTNPKTSYYFIKEKKSALIFFNFSKTDSDNNIPEENIFESANTAITSLLADKSREVVCELINVLSNEPKKEDNVP